MLLILMVELWEKEKVQWYYKEAQAMFIPILLIKALQELSAKNDVA